MGSDFSRAVSASLLQVIDAYGRKLDWLPDYVFCQREPDGPDVTTKIIVLGAEGMLGQEMLKTLGESAAELDWVLYPTSRSGNKSGYEPFSFPSIKFQAL